MGNIAGRLGDIRTNMAQRKLTPLPLCENTWKQLFGFDIETVNITNDFYMGAVVGNGEEKVFTDPYKCIEYITDRKTLKNNPYFCATNLKFDFFGILRDLEMWERCKFFLRNGRLIYGEIFSEDKKYKAGFLDTLSFYPASVEQLGKFLVKYNLIDTPKMEKPDTFLKNSQGEILYNQLPKNEEQLRQLEYYNIHDAKISMRFMQYLQDFFSNEGIKMKYTIGGTAMDCWRRLFQDKVYYQEDRNKIKFHFQTTARGGISLAYCRGELPCDTLDLDINSMYPDAMRLPMGDPNTSEWVWPNLDIIQEYQGTSYCEITCPDEEFYPLLGYKYYTTPSKYELLYPTGSFRGYYNHVELREALKLGYTIKFYGKSVIYKKEIYPLQRFAEYMYDARQNFKKEHNPSELVVKLLMNNLYGKFSQKMEKTILVHFSQISGQELERLVDNGCNIQFIGQHKDPQYWFWRITDPCLENYPKYIFPHWSNTITSAGRVKINQWKRKIKGVCFNVDTDGISIPAEGNNIPHSEELGEMKIVGRIRANEGCIVRPKMYYFHMNTPEKEYDLLKAKGIRGLKTVEEYYDILEEHKVMQKKFYQFSEFLNSTEDFKINQVNNNYLKNITLNDTKRYWHNRDFRPQEFQISQPWRIGIENGIPKKLAPTCSLPQEIEDWASKHLNRR